MSQHDLIRVSDYAIDRGMFLGIAKNWDETEKAIRRMAAASARTSHDYGNRRYGCFLMEIEEGDNLFVKGISIDDIKRVDKYCHTCFDSSVVFVTEPCPECDGDGCEYCNYEGGVSRAMPCPDCTHVQ